MSFLYHQIYKKQIPKFTEQLEQSGADPDGIFFNQAMERILYPKGHAGWKRLCQRK